MNNPHDKFFKELFSRKPDVIEFIKSVLPKEIINNIDFSTFKPDVTSYVDTHLQEHYSDYVYNCNYGDQPVKLAFLFEHKSSVPIYPHFQLLRYFINIQEHRLRQHYDPMPVIPIIVYHGERTWYYKSLREYFSGITEHIARFLPEFDYLLIDLSQYTDDQIRHIFHSTALSISLLLLKNIFDNRELRANFFRIFDKVPELLQKSEGENFFNSILMYLFYGSDLGADYIVHSFQKFSTTGGNIAMSTAEKLIKKGKQEGIREGIRKGKQEGIKETARKMIREGFKIETICKVTGLSQKEVEALQKK